MAVGLLFRTQSAKPLQVFLSQVEEKAPLFGFGVRHIFDMGNVYRERGAEVEVNFRVHSIMLCNFDGSYKSTQKNPERAAVLLQPKQIVVHETAEGLKIHYLPFPRGFIKAVLPEDNEFADGLARACGRVCELIVDCV